MANGSRQFLVTFISASILLGWLSKGADSIHPYMTCVDCDTFVECFFKCPRALYPGVNRDTGVYQRQITSSQRAEGALERWRPQTWLSYLFSRIRRSHRASKYTKRRSRHYKHKKQPPSHSYSNYVPYDPHRHPNEYLSRLARRRKGR